MKEPYFYKLVRPILYIFIKLYKPTYIGLENIPTLENFILVGNHTSYLDALLVASTTKRCVHFLAKDSLYKGIKKPLFKALGIIPVNRKIKDKNALNKAINCLNNEYVIGIFPEGTRNKTNDLLLSFKMGAVKMAKEANATIVPFVITGKYKFWNNNLTITFLEPFKVDNMTLEDANEKLRNMMLEQLKNSR